MNILKFKQGDEIVRVEPAQSYGHSTNFLTGEKTEGSRDRSYMGEKLTFHGIANGQIYCKPTRRMLFSDSDELIDLALDIWGEGWEKWIDPKTLTENVLPGEQDNIDDQIAEAIKNEDYEEVTRLNKLKK